MQIIEKSLLDIIDDGVVSHVNAENCEIAGLAGDSRRVKPGFLFVARSGGAEDGTSYIDNALERGAVAILLPDGAEVPSLPEGIAVLRSSDERSSLAKMAARFYGRQPGKVIGVTGTSGKTSIAAFTRQIWDYEGMTAASIGTVGIVSPTRNEYGSLTTPDPVDLQEVLAELAAEGVTHAALEASSHGLIQRRLDGVEFAAGAFCNLGHDHLDYHDTVEDYFAAKMRLFDVLLEKGTPAVIFADDPYSDAAIKHAKAAGLDVCTVGREGDFIKLLNVERDGFRQLLTIDTGKGATQVKLPLLGEFQVSNALVSAGLALVTGGTDRGVQNGMERIKGAPGRLEFVGEKPNGAMVFVDYAHKVEALENVLLALRPYCDGRLIVVFGCGGDRDTAKRPMMGAIARDHSDVAIVTDDNPRTEDPASIRKAILEAVPDAIEIGDRGDAIRHAISMARGSDVVVVAGKGHETGQIVGDKTVPFSDHEVVAKALREIAT